MKEMFVFKDSRTTIVNLSELRCAQYNPHDHSEHINLILKHNGSITLIYSEPSDAGSDYNRLIRTVNSSDGEEQRTAKWNGIYEENAKKSEERNKRLNGEAGARMQTFIVMRKLHKAALKKARKTYDI